jgi:hypothetical protein
LGNNCHKDRNSQIKKFLNLPGPPPFYKAHHKERAVIGRIFQALPTQTDTMFALIYKIEKWLRNVNMFNCVFFAFGLLEERGEVTTLIYI